MTGHRSENTPVPAPSLATLASTIKNGIEAVRADSASEHHVSVLSRIHLDPTGFRVGSAGARGIIVVDDRWSTWSIMWELAS